MSAYTREELIEICTKAVVPVEKWRNRDSPAAQLNVGKCWALLSAGCDFEVDPGTNDETIWVNITTPSFMTFEYGDSRHDETKPFYLPTLERIENRQGQDWY